MVYISSTNDHEPSVTVQIELHPDLYTILSEVAEEMELTIEELIVKIMQRWKKEMRVNIGEKGQFCHIRKEKNE